MSPDIDERANTGESPEAQAQRLAIEKAQKIAKNEPEALVIGSDQVALYNGTVVGKPITHERAVSQLRQASGHTVTLYTGLALVNSVTGTVQSDLVPYHI